MARSSASSSSGSNTKLLIIIGIFAFAIIVGTLIGSSYINRENFENENEKSKLVYLYMEGCRHCKDFDANWKIITDAIKENNDYNFTVQKFDLNKTEYGQLYGEANRIDYAPAILFIPANSKDDKAEIYNGARTTKGILEWATSMDNPQYSKPSKSSKAK